MDQAFIVNCYARKLYAHACAEDRVADWQLVLASVSQALESVSDKHPTSLQSGFIPAVLKALDDVELPQVTLFFKTLFRLQHGALLPEIARRFQDKVFQEQGGLEIEVTSAKPLNADKRATLESAWKKRDAKAKLAMTYREDPSLIAGLQIRINEALFDYSLAFHLNQFKNMFSTTQGISHESNR